MEQEPSAQSVVDNNLMFKFNGKYTLSILIAANLLLTAFLFLKTNSNSTNIDRKLDMDAYQAVFLTNSQIYFGHLRDEDSQYLVLKDVHYVQIGETTSGKDKIPTGKIVRLGETESHGPKNEMIINRDHILFWENLNFDSPVVQQIRNLQNK